MSFVKGDKVRITNTSWSGGEGIVQNTPQETYGSTWSVYVKHARLGTAPFAQGELELLEPVTASLPEPQQAQPKVASNFTFVGFDAVLNKSVSEFFAKIDKQRAEARDVAFLQGISFALSDSRAARDFLVERTNKDERGGK